jgi:hypothetical protein
MEMLPGNCSSELIASLPHETSNRRPFKIENIWNPRCKEVFLLSRTVACQAKLETATEVHVGIKGHNALFGQSHHLERYVRESLRGRFRHM